MEIWSTHNRSNWSEQWPSCFSEVQDEDSIRIFSFYVRASNVKIISIDKII